MGGTDDHGSSPVRFRAIEMASSVFLHLTHHLKVSLKPKYQGTLGLTHLLDPASFVVDEVD